MQNDNKIYQYVVVQSLSHVQLFGPMDPVFPVLPCLREFAQIHVHWVSDSIYPSHPLLLPSPFAYILSQHQGLFQWVGSLHQVAKSPSNKKKKVYCNPVEVLEDMSVVLL